MENFNEAFQRFFGVIGSGQAYLNLVYLLLAFPLGIFYFVFLVTGIAAGVPLLIVWVGVPILLLVIGGWWLLGAFERQLAILMLKEDIGPMSRPGGETEDLWTRFKDFLANPVTWKSLVYLFVKFPLGILYFVVIVTLGALTLAFLSAPLTYNLFNIEVDLWYGLPAWQIDSLNSALIAAPIGLLLWPTTLHLTNGLAWLSGRFAKLMLGLPEEPPSGMVEGKAESETSAQVEAARQVD